MPAQHRVGAGQQPARQPQRELQGAERRDVLARRVPGFVETEGEGRRRQHPQRQRREQVVSQRQQPPAQQRGGFAYRHVVHRASIPARALRSPPVKR